jgi:hypothetical protein
VVNNQLAAGEVLMHRLLLFLALAFSISALPAIVGAQAEPATARVRSLAGCYSLTLGAWSGSPSASVPASQTPPAYLRLDTLAALRDGFVVEPTSLAWSQRNLTSWQPTGTDSVRLIWSTGFVGVRLQLRVSGDTLAGVATTFTDRIMSPAPTARVVAVRTPCTTQSSTTGVPVVPIALALGVAFCFAAAIFFLISRARRAATRAAMRAQGSGDHEVELALPLVSIVAISLLVLAAIILALRAVA